MRHGWHERQQEAGEEPNLQHRMLGWAKEVDILFDTRQLEALKIKKPRTKNRKLIHYLESTAVNYITCTCRLGEHGTGTQDDESVQTARKED